EAHQELTPDAFGRSTVPQSRSRGTMRARFPMEGPCALREKHALLSCSDGGGVGWTYTGGVADEGTSATRVGRDRHRGPGRVGPDHRSQAGVGERAERGD